MNFFCRTFWRLRVVFYKWITCFLRDRIVRDVIGDQIWTSREVFNRFRKKEKEKEEKESWYFLSFLSTITGLYEISLHSRKSVRIELLLKIIS